MKLKIEPVPKEGGGFKRQPLGINVRENCGVPMYKYICEFDENDIKLQFQELELLTKTKKQRIENYND